MTPEEKARIIEECAEKVINWHELGRTHQQRVDAKVVVTEIANYLRARAVAIRSGRLDLTTPL